MSIVLAVHIAGAIILGILAIVGLYTAFVKNKSPRTYAVYIAAGSGLQLVSGSLLAIIQKSPLLAFCERIILYLLLITVIEMLFYIKIKHGTLPKASFPFKPLLASMLSGALAVILTITYLSAI
jgi:hypothetical protein